jgi:RNA polymerase sigma-70 factor (ECF subfamily)
VTAVSTRPASLRAVASVAIGDDDRQSVDRTLAGDTGAFGTLVEEHQDVVHRVAARIVGVHDADDVAQEAFLRAFHRLGQYRGDSSFRSWLLQITYNTAVDSVNRRRAEPAEAVPEQPEQAERGPAMRLEERERRERLEAKLRLMRPEHRAVIVLRDLEGLPYDDIAVATDAPLGSVKGRLHRARAELIELLRNNTYDWQLPR